MMYRTRQQNGSGIVDLVSDSRACFPDLFPLSQVKGFAPSRSNVVAQGRAIYSHSMLAGGLDVTSSTTRLA